MDLNELLAKAMNNDIYALNMLSEMYRYGKGVPIDINLSIDYAMKAVNLGSDWAKVFMYILYTESPTLIPSSYAEMCLKEAAVAGNADAKYFMGNLLYQDIHSFFSGKNVSVFNEGIDFNDGMMMLSNLMTSGVYLADCIIAGHINENATVNKERAIERLNEVLDVISTLIPNDRLYAVAKNFFKDDMAHLDYYMGLVGYN